MPARLRGSYEWCLIAAAEIASRQGRCSHSIGENDQAKFRSSSARKSRILGSDEDASESLRGQWQTCRGATDHAGLARSSGPHSVSVGMAAADIAGSSGVCCKARAATDHARAARLQGQKAEARGGRAEAEIECRSGSCAYGRCA